MSLFPKAGPKPAASAAERLFACYPQATPNRPKEYTAAVISLLAEYPAEIVDAVCDPRSGVATRCKFLPTIAELTEALEGEMKHPRSMWHQEYEKRKRLPPVERRNPTQEELERVRKIHDSLKSLGTFDPIEELRKEARAKRDAMISTVGEEK